MSKITNIIDFTIEEEYVLAEGAKTYFYRFFPPNLAIMTDDDKLAIINQLTNLLESLEIPVEFFAMDKTENLDLNRAYFASLSDEYAQYRDAIIQRIVSQEASQSSSIQRAYYIIIKPNTEIKRKQFEVALETEMIAYELAMKDELVTIFRNYILREFNTDGLYVGNNLSIQQDEELSNEISDDDKLGQIVPTEKRKVKKVAIKKERKPKSNKILYIAVAACLCLCALTFSAVLFFNGNKLKAVNGNVVSNVEQESYPADINSVETYDFNVDISSVPTDETVSNETESKENENTKPTEEIKKPSENGEETNNKPISNQTSAPVQTAKVINLSSAQLNKLNSLLNNKIKSQKSSIESNSILVKHSNIAAQAELKKLISDVPAPTTSAKDVAVEYYRSSGQTLFFKSNSLNNKNIGASTSFSGTDTELEKIANAMVGYWQQYINKGYTKYGVGSYSYIKDNVVTVCCVLSLSE